MNFQTQYCIIHCTVGIQNNEPEEVREDDI